MDNFNNNIIKIDKDKLPDSIKEEDKQFIQEIGKLFGQTYSNDSLDKKS